MRVFLASLFIITITGAGASANDYQFIQHKRQAVEQQRMQYLQQIQHKQANPTAFLASLNEGPKSESFKASPNGHFYVPASVNGRNVNFIADTGASSIFLTQDDARKLGINIDNLNYDKTYNTANGQIKAATTTIPSFSVGSINLSNVAVSVSSVKSGQSLLGMTFFSQLKSYNVENGVLTLYK